MLKEMKAVKTENLKKHGEKEQLRLLGRGNGTLKKNKGARAGNLKTEI